MDLTDGMIIGIDINERDARISVYDREAGSPGAGSVPQMSLGSFRDRDDVLYRCVTKDVQTFYVFLKNALAEVGADRPREQVGALMLAMPDIDLSAVKTVNKAYEKLGLPEGSSSLQDYEECIFDFTYNQPTDVFRRNVAIFRCINDDLVISKCLYSDRGTKPEAISAGEVRECELSDDAGTGNEEFRRFAGSILNNDFSAVILNGERFGGMIESDALGFLAQENRKVFYGDDLFAQGAAYAAAARCGDIKMRNYVFMGRNSLRNNIGIDMIVDSVPNYYPLLLAGTCWYAAYSTCEFILNDSGKIEFIISEFRSGRKSSYVMDLPGMPDRPPKATRVRLNLRYADANTCIATVTDMGLGEIFPSSGKVWKEYLRTEDKVEPDGTKPAL